MMFIIMNLTVWQSVNIENSWEIKAIVAKKKIIIMWRLPTTTFLYVKEPYGRFANTDSVEMSLCTGIY